MPAWAAPIRYNTDSLLEVLDRVVDDKASYEAKKRQSINRHLYSLASSADEIEEYTECSALFARYRKYALDSALHFAFRLHDIACRMGNADTIAISMMNIADGLKGLGRFNAALDTLHSIPRSDFVTSSPYYYHLLHSVTLSLATEAVDPATKKAYNKRLRELRDTIAIVNPPHSLGAIINQAEILKSDGNFAQAARMMEEAQETLKEEIGDYAIYWASLAGIYEFLGESEAAKGCYIKTSIIDLSNCVKTYTSLQDLAMLLYIQGDIEHAYRYITRAMEDIIESNARSRLVQVSEYMPIITSAYSRKQQEIHTKSLIFGIVLVMLALVLAAEAVALYRRNESLKSASASLDAKNEELTALNGRLTALNEQLHCTNERLNSTNERLTDANKIKEEYIAQLFIICSQYIDEFDHYRTSLSHKLKARQVDEVKKMIDKNLMSASLKEFFRKFDTIFLDLFPTFIEEFNALLQPDAHITPKEGELLTPELRIFALVRLGISDSARIASLLHYSLQTVYNYRMKIRNRSTVPKGKFAETVQRLC